MNIYGIGTDIDNVNRIKIAIKKNGTKFKKRIFTESEVATCNKRTNNISCFAKRFAAKEALFKAVGAKNKLHFRDVEITNNSFGAPNIKIKGKSLSNIKKLFKKKKYKIHLSLSDDKPWAVASVIIFIYN